MSEDPRISEIQALLARAAHWTSETHPAAGDARTLQRIRAILDSVPPVPGPGCYPPVDGWDGVAEVPAVTEDSAPSAPRVFLANDQVPVGTVITSKDGSPFRVPDAHASEGMARVGVPFVEVSVPSPEEWQAAVDQARAERPEVQP